MIPHKLLRTMMLQRVEEHRTVDDGSGRETTIRRILGDRSHIVTTKTDKEGNRETIENSNLDESKSYMS